MRQDKAIGAILTTVAFSAILGLAIITVFIFKEGVPIIFRVGGREFFFFFHIYRLRDILSSGEGVGYVDPVGLFYIT